MGTHSEIQALYLTVYNRPADWGGLLFWAGQLERQGFEAMSAAFTRAPEFNEIYGGLSAQGQVAKIYQHLLGREADAGGQAFWAAEIEAGQPVATVAKRIGEGAEGDDGEAFAERIDAAQEQTYGALIDVLYAGYYRRASDPEGRAFWIQELKDSAGELLPVITAFGNSQEYVEQYSALSSEQQVTRLYQNLFGRAPEEGGLSYWSGQLDSGKLDLSRIAFAVALGAQGSDRQALEATVDQLNLPVLTLQEALGRELLPERFILNADAPYDAGVVTVADARDTLTEVNALVARAESAEALTAGALLQWRLLDSAQALLAVLETGIPAFVAGADEVRVTDSRVSKQQLEALGQLDNFVPGELALAPSPALSIDRVTFGPEPTSVDEGFTFQITVTESADVAPENLQLTFAIPGVTSQTFNLASFQDRSLSFAPGADAINQPGSYQALFILDADNADPVEFQQELVILGADEGSIIVDAFEISDSDQLEPDDTFDVSLSLAEAAGNDVNDLNVQLVIEDAGIELALDANALAASGSIQVGFNDLSIDTAGFYEAEINISAGNARDVSATTGFTVTTTPYDAVEIADGLELLWTENTDLFPFSAIGQVQVRHEGSSVLVVGSGVLISPQHVMTNHHVLEGSSSLEAIEEINFFYGLNGSLQAGIGDSAFVSGGTEPGDGIWSLEGDIQFDSAADDIAIFRLDRPIDEVTGQFDWFWSESSGSRDLTGEEVMWAGYPVQGMTQDDPGTNDDYFYQWQAFGTIDGYEDDDGQLMLSDSLTGRGGASGSPLFRETTDGAELLGLYTGRIDFGGGDQVPVAATMTPEVHDWALGIVQADGYFMDIDIALG